MDRDDPVLIATLADLIRDVDGNHRMGAAELAEALVGRGVTVEAVGARVYAVAVEVHGGCVEPILAPRSTQGEAEQELEALLGDDYYRDRRPFVATSTVPAWVPVEASAPHAGAVDRR